MPPQYAFDSETMGYYYIDSLGRRRLVPAASVAQDAVRLSIAARKQLQDDARELMSGTMTLQQWYDTSQRDLKLYYYAAIAAARGMAPSEPMRTIEIAFLLWLLLRQFEIFDDLADGIEAGTVAINGRFVNRAGQYGAATKGMYENFRLWQAKIGGWAEARRVLGFAEHCQDSSRPGCIELAAKGWMPIAQMTPLGDATCLSNCRCTIEYRTKRSIGGTGDFPGFVQQAQAADGYRDVRDEHGKLLFRYDAEQRLVQIKHKGMDKPRVISLDRIEQDL